MLTDPDANHVKKALKNLDLKGPGVVYSETAKLADVICRRHVMPKDGTFTNAERRVQRVKRRSPRTGQTKLEDTVRCSQGQARV